MGVLITIAIAANVVTFLLCRDQWVRWFNLAVAVLIGVPYVLIAA